MNIYDYEDYRAYLSNWIAAQPNNGRGILKKWASECSVHSTLLSQIMAKKKDMSLEVAEKISQSIGLSDAEFDYFSLLVLYSRAGTASLRNQLKRKIKQEQEHSINIGSRLKVTGSMSDEAKAIFYSSWLYSGIRNLTAIEKFKDVESISEKIGMSRKTVQEIIRFLLEVGLCTQDGGKLNVGAQRTHVNAESPFVVQHHQNWRVQGFNKMVQRRKEDLFFTFPMSLSNKDADKIRKLLPQFVESIHKIVGPSESETIRCLNFDFFEY
ncbi:MAG: TIGR02147 family protein [Bdellovibrionaceae bacterium]|nr:TIGR02147 family protein [Pseudobdellovibrionaceae bacterium]